MIKKSGFEQERKRKEMNRFFIAGVLAGFVCGCATIDTNETPNTPLEVGFRVVMTEGVVTTKPTAFKGAQTGVCVVVFDGGGRAITRLVTVDMPIGENIRFGDRVKLEVAEQVGGDVVYHIKTESIPPEKKE
ncbi:MAG: hypothetical protein A2571_02630 [Candidatus Vogelbacteria bacterium RIFOXYD1_FULL_44_32]|uniref:Uncharacterized protein n=1 Tax=Candidatus Vogelbacteria bacterium RIFOXYD1_FULL_44_32 TaxID=1802438 RepID=A0A1G2QDH8_9BACT|nr:MAG: hypothetical protein A2571_02630 [Candidatus Vogelbacteria bacterium RIFOXYD1_FULL_44_32]